jgi:hypothetical protein
LAVILGIDGKETEIYRRKSHVILEVVVLVGIWEFGNALISKL